MLRAKNCQNRPMFYGVIQKIKVVHVFETRCISITLDSLEHYFYFCSCRIFD